MKPSPPVTTHRRPVNGSTGMGSRARSVYVTARFSPRDRTATVAETRTSPSTDSHIASSDSSPPHRTAPASSTGSPRSTVPRYSTLARVGTRPGRQRASSSSKASSDRALLTWSSTSKSLARSGHGRTSASGDGGPCTRRPRTRRPRAASPKMVWKSLVQHQRTPAATIDDRPTSATVSTSAPCSPVMIVRRSAQRGPMPLQNVVSSTGSWYQGGRTMSTSVERTTQTPVAIGEAGVVGVIGGDVLQVAGDGGEPQPGRRRRRRRGGPAAATGTPGRGPGHRRTRRAPAHGRTASHRVPYQARARVRRNQGIGARGRRTTRGTRCRDLLERLGRRAVRHRWWFISVWVVVAVAVVALAGVLDGQFSDNFRIPDTQSQQALDLLERDFPSRAGDNALVVFQSDAGHHQLVRRAGDQRERRRARRRSRTSPP